MTADMRRIVATSRVQKRDPREKWAPGSWQAAAAYNATKPEVRYPVVLGGNSMFRTPDDLRSFRHLQYLPTVVSTTKSATLGSFNGKAPQRRDDDEAVQVMEVSQREYLDHKKSTQGDAICVWFGGQTRFAWVARSVKGGGWLK